MVRQNRPISEKELSDDEEVRRQEIFEQLGGEGSYDELVEEKLKNLKIRN